MALIAMMNIMILQHCMFCSGIETDSLGGEVQLYTAPLLHIKYLSTRAKKDMIYSGLIYKLKLRTNVPPPSKRRLKKKQGD